MVFNSELKSIRWVSFGPLNTAHLFMPAVLFSITLFPLTATYFLIKRAEMGGQYCWKTALVTLNSISM